LRPSIVLALAIGFTIAALLLPLLVFAVEVAQNPTLLGIQVDATVLNQSHVALTVALSYTGTIPLTDVQLMVCNRSMDLGDLHEGATKTVTIPLSVDEAPGLRPSDLGLRFKVMGIYHVEVRAID